MRGSLRPRTRVLILLTLGLSAAQRPADANGILRDSLGAISSGRGGANVAHSDNLSTIHDNPAGVSWMEESLRIEFGTDLLFPNVEYNEPAGGDRSREGLFFLPHFAVAYRPKEWPLTLGLGVFLPGGYGVEYKLDHPVLGRETYRSEGMLLKILPSASLRLGDHVSLGAGIGVGYGSSRIKAPYTFQTGPLALQSGLIDLDTDGFTVTGNFGIQVRPLEGLVLGVAFITETALEQDGSFDLDITGTPLAGLVTDPTATYDVEHTLRWPRSLTAGASYETDWGRLSTEVAWTNWGSAFDDLTFNLSNSGNAEFDALAGPTPSDTLPLDWEDSVAVRVGYEHFFTEKTTARIGYIFNHNPIPESTLTPLLPGILEHTITVGIGHDFGQAEIHASYQFAFGRDRDVGTSTIQGGDFDSSTVRAQAHWLFLGLTAKF